MKFRALYPCPPPPLEEGGMGTHKKVKRGTYREVKGHLLDMNKARVKVKGVLLILKGALISK